MKFCFGGSPFRTRMSVLKVVLLMATAPLSIALDSLYYQNKFCQGLLLKIGKKQIIAPM